ncbi:MAG: HEAT repeat domain-containing protein [Acidimicrobiia bacterium]|nr:HEAT repeat domain-containing protein [Acidimicrobiia bacterium]
MLDATATTTRSMPPIAPPDAPRGPAGDAADDAAAALAAGLVDALAVAWTMCRVYQDPRPHDAYRRAVATLGAVPSFPFTLEVHGTGFRWDDRPLPARREAASAFARAAFARGISGILFASPPGPDDLLHLLELVTSPEAPGGHDPGPAAALAQAGVSSLTLLEHGRLTSMPETLARGAEEIEDEPDAGGPVPAASGDAPDAERRYLGEYRLLFERLQAGDFRGLQELVHGFTDSFFDLPREQQSLLFEQFLARREEEPFRLLLDQFSDEDLHALAQLLAPEAHPRLVDYARIAAAQEGQSGRALEMLTAEQLVSDRITQMLRPENADLRRRVGESLRAQVPGPQENLRAGIRVAEALVGMAAEDGFARLAAVFAGKVHDALAAGDPARAGAWARLLLAHSHTPERKAVVRGRVEEVLQVGTLDRLVDGLAAAPEGPPEPIVALVALFAADPVVEILGRERNQARRRALVALLIGVARLRPGALVNRLSDRRGYLVLHLIEALARCGREEAAPGLRSACKHPDPAVRAEALSALAGTDPAAGAQAALAALADAEAAVRLRALSVLRAPASGLPIDGALSRFLAGRPSPQEQTAAVAVLARRDTAEARRMLQHLARLRPGSGVARPARAAARQALAGGRR